MLFTDEEKRLARKADLYEYLINNHKDDIELCGNSLKLKSNHSMSVRKGYCGYYDFADGAKGNSVDFLTKILGYSYADAVQSLLTRSATVKTNIVISNNGFALPKQSADYADAIEYLRSRGLDNALIDMLMQYGLIYQSQIEGYERIVFVNTEGNYYEVHEIQGNKFRRVKAEKNDYFWHFNPNVEGIKRRCYICESAIDAMSLYQLIHDNANYCSIGGVGNYQRIRKAIQLGFEVILAVDNDGAGEKCRAEFPELEHLIPNTKDWNSDLMRSVRS